MVFVLYTEDFNEIWLADHEGCIAKFIILFYRLRVDHMFLQSSKQIMAFGIPNQDL